jgi:hypothetical protein
MCRYSHGKQWLNEKMNEQVRSRHHRDASEMISASIYRGTDICLLLPALY